MPRRSGKPSGYSGKVRVATTVLGTSVLLTALAGCGAQEPPLPDSGLSGAAIDACLAAAAEQNDFPVDGPGATTVSAEPDDQGWWAVTVRVETDDRADVLTCTAVPDEDGGARAASWSTEQE